MSSILQVEGGSSRSRGEITVRGAKNFVPKAMVASPAGRHPLRAVQRAAHPRHRRRL